MLDYKGIEALYWINELKSFERAAEKLYISQSAISQRLKALEVFYSKPVLIRSAPYKPTRLGAFLMGHYKRIILLEETLDEQLDEVGSIHIPIALNRDSLEIWFLEFLKKKKSLEGVTLEIIADDQERTLDTFKEGSALCALSTQSKSVMGANVQFLGNMEYVLVSTPTFQKKYLKDRESYLGAKAICFDSHDFLLERYLEKNFKLDCTEIEKHVVPSIRGFKEMVLLGMGYTLIPKIDIIEELNSGKLVELEKVIEKVPLYWHYWEMDSRIYRTFNQEVVEYAKELFKPMSLQS